MTATVLIAALALGVSLVSLAYKFGRDTKCNPPPTEGGGKLDQIYDRLMEVCDKVDKIAEWQREATSTHAKQGEQIKTLFEQIKSTNLRLDRVESRMEDREVITKTLQKILERVS